MSIKVIKSSLFPTAMVWPFGDQQMLMFSPFVLMVACGRLDLMSQMRTVLSSDAVHS